MGIGPKEGKVGVAGWKDPRVMWVQKCVWRDGWPSSANMNGLEAPFANRGPQTFALCPDGAPLRGCILIHTQKARKCHWTRVSTV